MMTTQDLSHRWLQLGMRLEIPQTELNAVWQALSKAYGASSRHYHNLTHLADLLQQWDRATLQAADEVALAIWFHDWVYEALRKDNEAKSAAKAKAWLTAQGLETGRIQRVVDWIEATAGHQPRTDSPDERWFLDADLSILGADSTRYEQYTQQIRAEYRLVPDLLYRPGRAKVIKSFLNRTQLYFTPAFQDQYEEQARLNLERELATLTR